jgi:chromosomal replication initiation ATPase DnaA
MTPALQTITDTLDRQQLLDESRAICAALGVTLTQVASKSRLHNDTFARHRIWVLLRDRTGMSYPEIGRAFQADHSTVMSAVAGWRRSQVAQ